MPIRNKEIIKNYSKPTGYTVSLRPYNQDMVTANSLVVADKIAEINDVAYRAIDMLLTKTTFGFGTDQDGNRFVSVEYIGDENKADLIGLVTSSSIKFAKVLNGFPEAFKIEGSGNKDDDFEERNLEIQFALGVLLLKLTYCDSQVDLSSYLRAVSTAETEEKDYNNALAILSDYLYRKLIGRGKTVDLSALERLALGHAKKYEPTSKKIDSVFTYFNKDYTPAVKKIEIAENLSYGTTELTEEEKRLVPKIPDWFVEPIQLGQIVGLITGSTKTVKPKRNFMFRGPSSTGKTTLAKAVAAKLGKPYVYLTCSADTESYDFLGQPMYDAEGKVKFIESQFIKAIKNGYVVEIQEPYVIAKQGVLTALNGLLDDSNGITLSTGEYVERHPDTVVILTTNVNYVGCRMPNQSVLRRMNAIYDIDMPDAREIKERIVATTGFDNKAVLNSMVDVFYQINRHLEEEDVTDGVCTVSELIDWASATMILNSVTDAAQFTIVSKSTCDLEMQATVAQLVSATLEGVTYK